MVREGEKISPAKGINLKDKDEFTLENLAELELLADSDKHIWFRIIIEKHTEVME